MNTSFDELTKTMAQSVTRKQALKKFGFGLASMALAWFGFTGKTYAGGCKKTGAICRAHYECCSGICDGLLIHDRKGSCT